MDGMNACTGLRHGTQSLLIPAQVPYSSVLPRL